MIVAKYAAGCDGCDRPVEVGQEIELGLSGWVHVGCAETAAETAVSRPDYARVAFHAGHCGTCDEAIEVGQLIGRGPYRWVHAGCVDAAYAAFVEACVGAKRSDPGYAVTCETCGAAPEESCRTSTGKKAGCHAGRNRAARVLLATRQDARGAGGGPLVPCM